MINSHILLPKMLLKRFEDEKNFLQYIDVTNNRIKRGHAKTMYTEKGYYSDEIEHYLSDKIEKPFSEMLGIVDSITSCDQIDGLVDEPIRKYIVACFSRSPNMISLLKDGFYLKDCEMQEQELHDYAVKTGMNVGMNLFDDFYASLIFNNTSIMFVLPICGFYGVVFEKKNMIVLPITPKYALYLTKKFEECDGNIRHVYCIEDDEIVTQFNVCAYNCQVEQKYGYIISSKKNVLEELLRRVDLVQDSD